MQFSSQINWFLCNHSDGPLKTSRRPAVSRSFSIKDIRTSEQHRPNARSSYSKFYTELDFSRHSLRSFCKTFKRRGNTSGRYPVFQNILGFLYGRGKEWQLKPSECSPSCSDVVLLWEESRYSRKAVAEDRPNEAYFRLDANLPESDFEQN